MPSVVVIGGGLAGLVAAVRLAELGDPDVVVLESGHRPGGTSARSTGWIWRYRELDDYAHYAPRGDRAVQRAIWQALPSALEWLELATGRSFIAPLSANVRTESVRADMPHVCRALAERLGPQRVRCATEVSGLLRAAGEYGDGDGEAGWLVTTTSGEQVHASNVVLAGGGYGANLARIAAESGASVEARSWWQLRNAGGSRGVTLDLACAVGAAMSGQLLGECYVRATPQLADGRVLALTQAAELAQVYAQHATVIDAAGQAVPQSKHDWADTLVIDALARRSGRGWLVIADESLDVPTPHGTIAELIEAARVAGCDVLTTQHSGTDELASRLLAAGTDVSSDPAAALAVARGSVAVPIVAGITHTMAGLRVDPCARVLDEQGEPIAGLHAAGIDVGGVSTGGYSSGLAQALALGRIAAASISDVKQKRGASR